MPPNRPKRAENSPSRRKYPLRGCVFREESCPNRGKLLFLFVKYSVTEQRNGTGCRASGSGTVGLPVRQPAGPPVRREAEK